MDRREFLALTAGAPVIGLIPAEFGSWGLQEKEGLLTECLAGSIELASPSLDVYGPHCLFFKDIPFTSNWITLEVVPKFECFSQPPNGNTYHKKKNGKIIPVKALLDISLGKSGSEMPYVTDLYLRKENQYVIPFSIPKGARITLRIKDGMQSPTRYKAHMAITGATE